MEFYVVYKIGEDGGQFDSVYFMNFDKAHAYYLEWEDDEPQSTILLEYACTED